MAAAHPELLWIVISSGITCALLAISIGANDVANAFSTSVGSGTLSLRGAITIAFIFEILGSLFLGGRVTDAIRTRVLNISAFSDNPYELALGMLCSSVGSTIWLIFATYFGIPVSTTHSIIGALAGFGLASGRLASVRWIQLLFIILSWFVVPVISIVITGTFYVIIQELILKKTNSYDIMRKYHWVFLIIFSIPLSIFIAFENSFLRASEGRLADSYREWFESSNWNKFASIIIVLCIFVFFSCIVTYTVCYLRLRSGWSFIDSIKNINQILSYSPKSNEPPIINDSKKDVVENNEPPIHVDHPPEESYTKNDSEMFTNDQLSLTGYKQRSTDLKDFENDSECHVTITTDSVDISIREGRVDITDVTKKSFSRSIIDALLGSVGFPMTPRCSRESSRFSSSDLSGQFGENQEVDHENSLQSQGSRFNRFMTNLRNSYNKTLNKTRNTPKFRRFKSNKGSRVPPPTRCIRETLPQSKPSRYLTLSSKMRENIRNTQTVFSAMQIVGATICIISHSANDTANTVLPFATVYFLYNDGVTQTEKNTPWFILLSGGLCMSIGLALFGYKVIKTVGLNITRVTPSRGYTIDSTAGGIVLVLSHIGIPLSSTHVTVSSIFGVGLIEHVPNIYLGSNKHEDRHSQNIGDEQDDYSNSSGNKDNDYYTDYINYYEKIDENVEDNQDANADGNNENIENEYDIESNVRYNESGQKVYEQENEDTSYEKGPEHVDNEGKKAQKRFLTSRLTLKHVNVKLYRKIFFTWIITMFSSGFLTAVMFLICKLIYKISKR